MSEWPSINCTERRSAPFSSRCVANECRSTCGEMCALIPACRAYLTIFIQNDCRDIGRLRLVRKRCGSARRLKWGRPRSTYAVIGSRGNAGGAKRLKVADDVLPLDGADFAFVEPFAELTEVGAVGRERIFRQSFLDGEIVEVKSQICVHCHPERSEEAVWAGGTKQ